MIKRYFFLFLLSPILLHSQDSLKGTIEQGENLSWVLLYKIKNGQQIYVDNADVKNNEFEFTILENEDPGIYRVFYQIEDQLYIEFIYNRENIELHFNANHPIETLQFSRSDENQLYQDYDRRINYLQRRLDSLQVAFFNSEDEKNDLDIINSYKKQLDLIDRSQLDFENRSKGKLANHFIVASKQFNAKEPVKNPQVYLDQVKQHFFNSIDFRNAILSNSTLIHDKVLDYIFYLNQSNDLEALNRLQKESIHVGLDKLGNDFKLKKNIEESILTQYAEDQNDEMVHFVLDNHYDKLPFALQDMAFKNHILSEVKTAVGTKSPDIQWEEKGVSKSLYNADDANIYIIVFFSSVCPHCLVEIPEFHEFIQETKNIKVIAIGLEDEQTGWENMVKDLESFTHIIDLNKWDSPRVQDFGISAIPNYLILNQEKIIIAKPEDIEALKSYFE